MRKNILDNPIIILLFSFFSVIINLISSVHFISIMLCGVMFLIAIKCFENRYYYSLVIVTFAFLIIENIIGLKPFTLILFSYFSYVFIINNLKKTIVSEDFINILLIIWFYFGIFLLFTLNIGYEVENLSIILINIFIDIFIIGVFI